jgi:hypothetical protein
MPAAMDHRAAARSRLSGRRKPSPRSWGKKRWGFRIGPETTEGKKKA